MLRFLIKLVIWVTLARWMYAETALVTPGLLPYVNSALNRIQIPTHDKWKDSTLGRAVLQELPAVGDVKERLTANFNLPIQSTSKVLTSAAQEFKLSAKPSMERF